MPTQRTTRITISVAVAGLALTLAACSPTPAASESAANSSYPMTIDNCGEELQIKSEPESVLTIGSAAISLLDAAGASDRIIARSGEFGADLPAGLTTPPADAEIIDPSDPSTEKIIGAAASVVVGYGLYNSTPEDLAAVDIPNLTIEGECSHDGPSSEPTTFDAVFDDINRLATVFGTTDVANSNVEDLRAELEELEASGGTSEERSAAIVYYFSSSATMSSFGGLGIANDILTRAGLDNAYGDEESVYLDTNIETLLDADPEVLVISYGLYGEDFDTAKAKLLAEPGAADLQAVQNDMVIGVLSADLSPSPDAIRGLRTVIEGVGQAG